LSYFAGVGLLMYQKHLAPLDINGKIQGS